MAAFNIIYTATDATGGTYHDKSSVVFDFNGDGLDDFFAFGLVFPPKGPASAPARLYIQQADGTFVTSLPLADGSELFTTLVGFGASYFGDLNGDGIVDVFAATSGWDAPPFPGEQNRLLIGTAEGKFIDATHQLPARIDFAHSYASGDIDHDGDIDFYVGNIDGSGPYLLLNDGKANFTQNVAMLPEPLRSSAVEESRYATAKLADLNNDGNLDLILGSFFNSSMVYWGDASGAFAAERSTILLSPGYAGENITLGITNADFDGDGYQDLLLSGVRQYGQSGGIQLLLNDGDNTFTDATAGFFSGGTAVTRDIYQLSLLDLNGDGARDIIRTNIYPGASADETILWVNDGANRFTAVTAAELGLADAFFELWYRGPNDEMRILAALGDFQGGGFVNFYAPTAEFPEAMSARPANDKFVASDGEQAYNGGNGIDEISYSGGSSASYEITKSSSGYLEVEGDSLSHRLLAIERLHFSDGFLAFDLDGTAGQAYRLYQAAFDRTPDADGLGYWIRELDAGKGDLAWMANNFIISEEFKSTYGSPETVSDEQFLNLLYQNVLNRNADGDGFTYWMNELQSGFARERVLASFSESIENRQNVADAIQDGIWYV